MTVMEAAVRIVVDLIVRGQYTAVERITRGRGMTADELERAVAAYGRTLVSPDDEWWSLVDVTEIAVERNAFHVAAPMWTVEEGRSDLTLELRLRQTSAGIFESEILDLHVL
jgi:hypothetical protein